jgi:cytochrome c peroxidase
MRLTKFSLLCSMLISEAIFAHGPLPTPLQNVPIPPVPGLLDGSDPIVIDKAKAIALGKALFWDVNVGSDGVACGSCHFNAGADRRIKNQVNPGQKSIDSSPNSTAQTFEQLPSGASSGGQNYTMTTSDFPTLRYTDPLIKGSGVSFITDDVVGSGGTFSGDFSGTSKFTGKDDQCARAADPVFHIGATGTRLVAARNAPTVINAVFNYRNFWDGRANNIYNGFSPWGERDTNNGLWLKTGARTVIPYRLHLQNSSLASQSMGPPLNNAEMSCNQRKWPNIGRKLLLRQPLQNQNVHYEDSVLGAYSLSSSGNLKPGMNTTYKRLVMQAFNSKYWSFSGAVPIAVTSSQAPYNQMEANFSMFFGLALQLYESSLISDQSPFDLSPRNPINFEPTWQGMGKTQNEIDVLTLGFQTFSLDHCNLCHAGPAFTSAAIALNSALVTPTADAYYGPDDFPIPYGLNALGDGQGGAAAGISQYVNVVTRDTTLSESKLMDFGFTNTGVNDPNADPGLAGLDDFGNPLSYSDQYVQYLLGNYSAILDPGVNTVRSCDFLISLAVNFSGNSNTKFTSTDGIQLDGSRENNLRGQNCYATGYIPTISAANTALSAAPAKLSIAKQAAFKVPGLRNIELTGPYMHNGSMATLEQVMEFYTRKGNFDNPDIHRLMSNLFLAGDPDGRAALMAFLKTLTDDRVRYEKAPFDHPEISIPNGHIGDNGSVTPGNPLNANLAKDEYLHIPAVGANGSVAPLQPFENYLAP